MRPSVGTSFGWTRVYPMESKGEAARICQSYFTGGSAASDDRRINQRTDW